LIIGGLSNKFTSGATVAEIVEQVSTESYTNYLQNELYTHDGDERCFGPQHDLAQQRIRELFESFGLETSLHPFEYMETTCYNVVGVHLGISCPDEIFVLGAHYDSVEGSPGAWDNASGVAGILESARVLSQHTFEGTIVFIAFDREEQGSKDMRGTPVSGSAAYVNDHLQDRIHGMINIDNIAWRAYGPEHPDYNKIGLYHASKPTWLSDDLVTAVESYAGLTCVVDSSRRSDHTSFDNGGFAAAWLISYDMEIVSNPFYHTALDSVDQPDYIDYDHGTRVTRAVVGYLASRAILAPVHIYPDFDGDGDVDIDDSLLLIDHWKGSDAQFDIAPPPSGDGVINDQDFAAVMHYWLSDRSSWWPEFGPIAHWKLDESEGSIAHDSAGDNDATLVGEPVWQETGGWVDGALELDGIDDGAQAGFVLDQRDGPFSAFAWVKGGGPGQVIISQAKEDIGRGVNWLLTDSMGNLKSEFIWLTTSGGSLGPDLFSSAQINDGQWHHVGLVWDLFHGTRILYVDGIEVAKDMMRKGGWLWWEDGGINIGFRASILHLPVPGVWSGLIDDVRIYDRALTPEQIAELAQ
jgi:hypothetical protein